MSSIAFLTNLIAIGSSWLTASIPKYGSSSGLKSISVRVMFSSGSDRARSAAVKPREVPNSLDTP